MTMMMMMMPTCVIFLLWTVILIIWVADRWSPDVLLIQMNPSAASCSKCLPPSDTCTSCNIILYQVLFDRFWCNPWSDSVIQWQGKTKPYHCRLFTFSISCFIEVLLLFFSRVFPSWKAIWVCVCMFVLSCVYLCVGLYNVPMCPLATVCLFYDSNLHFLVTLCMLKMFLIIIIL